MKKYTFTALIATCLTLTQGALAADGTMNFKGRIDNNTCVVDTDSKNLIVTLPTVSTSALSYDGATAGLTKFNLNVTCPTLFPWGSSGIGGSNAPALYLEANPINTDFNTGNLKNTASSDAASNVQIQLINYIPDPYGGFSSYLNGKSFLSDVVRNASGNLYVLPYYAPYSSTYSNPVKHTVHLSAEYIAVGGAATPGNVSSTITYTVIYL